MKSIYRAISFCLLMVLTGLASATPVRWELQNVTLIDEYLNSYQLSGSFIYDADLALGYRYLDVSITGGQLGDYYSGQSNDENFGDGSDSMGWFFMGSTNNSGWVIEVASFTGDYLFLDYATDLSNAGGVVGLVPGSYNGEAFSGPGEVSCDFMEGCDGGLSTYQLNAVNDGPPDFGTSGYLVGTVVPIPAAIWLFGSALAGLGWLRCKNAP